MNYYIQGNKGKAKQIKAAFEKLGYYTGILGFTSSKLYYTIEGKVELMTFKALQNLIKTHPDYKELELPVEHKFEVGDWIVRNNGSSDIPIQVYGLKKDRYLVTNMLGSKGQLMINRQDEWRLWTIQDVKDGDVLCTYECGNPKIVFILRGNPEGNCSVLSYYCYYNIIYPHFEPNAERGCLAPKREDVKPATKEQRGLLFKKMKEAGYQWDAEKKELRKIIKTKFKAGDEIKTGNTIETITEVDYATRSYCCKSGRTIWFENQDLWHLAPKPHYDVSNFHAGMPVLVRADNGCSWDYSVFSRITDNEYWKFSVCNGVSFTQCIPFNNDTKHLLGTTDMPDEMYINW